MNFSTKTMKDTASLGKEPPRKRVARACDRCRLKKGKCDGKEQCAKCVSADVMCIYTDRKPPQHKVISPAVAEALQSENLTLKKATITIYKQLMRDSQLPHIDGVEWDSEKVISGKSGRALNYIIQQAGVDNRISNEEITNYDSDSHVESKTCPDSPQSRGSSPPSVVAENPISTRHSWGYDQSDAASRHSKKPKTSRASYHGPSPTSAASMSNSIESIDSHLPHSQNVFIDPNLLQPLGPAMFTQNPPTPPSGFDAMDFLPPDLEPPTMPPTSSATSMDPTSAFSWADQQPRFYNNGNLILQQYRGADTGELLSGTGGPGMAMGGPEFYHYLGTTEKDFRKVIDPMDVSMYDQ